MLCKLGRLSRMGLIMFAPLLALGLSGCAGTTMIVFRAPPASTPSFTILPPNRSPEETMFALKVEQCIMRLGFKVTDRPAFRYTKLESSGGTDGTGRRTEATIDPVAMYGDIVSEYIVATHETSQKIRIIRHSDMNVVAIISEDHEHRLDNIIFTAFVHMGLLKDNAAEKIQPLR